MEVALIQTTPLQFLGILMVSILVFMEVALILLDIFSGNGIIVGFNPCFYGSGSNTQDGYIVITRNYSFNPCFYGSGSNTG